MLARCRTAALVGVQALPVAVEVDVHNGLPSLELVGLASASVKEARDRVRGAVRNAGWSFPPRRITVNLAPGNLRKAGTHFDLPVALGVLLATRQVASTRAQWWAAGELGLSGELRPVPGVLPLAMAARRGGAQALLVPAGNAAEAGAIRGLQVVAARDLAEAAAWLAGAAAGHGPTVVAPPAAVDGSAGGGRGAVDLADVRGQATAKRALVIAAAGGHNLQLLGPPGTGKTMLARCLPDILPDLDEDVAFEATAIHSAAGCLPAGSGLLRRPPFRAPAPGMTLPTLLGGGRALRPGELSLAHGGVLFIDEAARYSIAVLEALRAPLEDGEVVVARQSGSVRFPARTQVVLADNPCPCGWYGTSKGARECRCSEYRLRQYRDRLSGPLRDRIDLTVEMPRPAYAALATPRSVSAGLHDTASARAAVAACRAFQRGIRNQVLPNARIPTSVLERSARLDAAAARRLADAYARFGLGPRGRARVLRVARTIADLAEREQVASSDLAEALHFRLPDAR